MAKRLPRLTFSGQTLWLWRLFFKLPLLQKTPDDVSIRNLLIPAQDEPTQIRLRIYRAKSQGAPAPVLVWLHGGGYIIGKPEQDDPQCIQYVREAGVVVVAVAYRYAPEHPFPTGLEDGYAALQWITAHAEQIGADPARLAIGGASAGAGLAAALVQLARDRGEIQPRFQLLVYPMLDDRTALRTDLRYSHHLTWNQASNRYGWEAYLGKACGTNDLPAYSVPARRANLSGLPPAWIGVGTLDLFYDEDVAYAQRLQDSGVECETSLVPGAFHGFDLAGTHVPVVRDFRAAQMAALKKYLFS